MPRWKKNDPEAFARCDGCHFEKYPNRDFVRASRAAAEKHHKQTGHEIRVEVTYTLWIAQR